MLVRACWLLHPRSAIGYFISPSLFLLRVTRGPSPRPISGGIYCARRIKRIYICIVYRVLVCTSDLSEKNEALYMIYATNGKRIQSRQDSRPANSHVLLIRSKIRTGTKTKLYTARHPTPTDRTRLESRNSLYGTAAEQQSQHERRCKHAPLPRADSKEAGRMGYESSTIKHGRGTRMRIAGTGPCLRTTEDGAISRDKPARRATTSSPQRAELPLRGRRCRAPTAQACSARRWEA